MNEASYYIKHLNLLPHPEGGFYCETYRANGVIPKNALPAQFKGDRSYSTAIYFLLEEGNFSAFHKIQSDELWHFYAGDTLEIIVIDEKGDLKVVNLGPELEKGETFQYVVPAQCWFSSRVKAGGKFVLVGCTVAPGFDFADFELADREKLLHLYPKHNQTITELTR
jgi:uncharacterized protein